MPGAVIALGPWTVEYHQEWEPEEGLVPDEGWRFIDAAGHGHFCKSGKWPTLKLDTSTVYCDEHDDDEEISRLLCPHCGEEVRPSMVDQSLTGRRKPGPIRMRITHRTNSATRVFEVYGDDAKAVLENPVEELPRITAELQPVSITREFGA